MAAHATAAAGSFDSAAAWRRLAVTTLISTVGSVGMWSAVVVLPDIQAAFGIDRAAASLPYTFLMAGFALGGILHGRLVDRFGVVLPVSFGAAMLCLGYVVAGMSPNVWVFALAHGVLIGGLGASAMFAPLLADISHWFRRRRGIAVSVAASGNYLAGALWPPLIQNAVGQFGWRPTLVAIGVLCLAVIVPIVQLLRARAPAEPDAAPLPGAAGVAAVPGMSTGAVQGMLLVAGVSCCVAMSMPQVHIVAYCGDLGYGVARGAEMLSLMLGFGIVSRVASGFVADRIGGLATLALGSALQGVALLLYLGFDGLASLYVISALFGLFQGGIVPSYAIIVREIFPPREAGARVGTVIMATLVGMALGGWMSGKIFDLTGSYAAAFANGVLWNLVNLSIVAFLLVRQRLRLAPA